MAIYDNDLISSLYKRVKEYHLTQEILPDEIKNKNVQNERLIPILRPYQIKAVKWMLARENINATINILSNEGVRVELPNGGILADEMGLGKTVEVLACILENPLLNLEEQKDDWLKKVFHIAKAYECIVPKKEEIQDIICSDDDSVNGKEVDCVLQTGEISRESGYPTRRNRSCKRTSYKDLLDEIDSDNNEYNEQIGQPDNDVSIKSEQSIRRESSLKCTLNGSDSEIDKKRKKKENTALIGTKKKRIRNSRSKIVDDDYTVAEKSIGQPKKKRSSCVDRKSLNSWYESLLMETTVEYRDNKREALKFVPNLRCCCSTDDKTVDLEDINEIKCPACNKTQHTNCVSVEGDFDLSYPYLCFQCWPKQEHLVPSACTIIITPSAILNQWLTEIDKHIKTPGLNILVYEGVRKNGYLQPTVLAQYDIVITSYQVLIRELDYVESCEGSRKLRYAKKFLSPTSPLTSVLWWRLCLDEAQMVETPTTKVANMVKNLKAVNKWAVCGTPFQKSIHDIYGLIDFLKIQPYCDLKYWSRIVENQDILYELIPYLMWRMSKNDVLEEIGIPPQSVLLHSLRFSPIEIHFYQKQHEKCSNQFMERWQSFDNVNILLDKVDFRSTKQLMGPLLALRQACVHPQLVKGQFVALKKTMTMNELLKAMVQKAIIDCEGALRINISSLNGIAALNIILGNIESAIERYREVLHLIQDYDGKLKVDSLQKIHCMHNLAEIFEFKHVNVPKTLRDDTLRDDVAELERIYLDKRKGDMDSTQKMLENFSKKIKEQSKVIPLNATNWLVDGLTDLQDPDSFIQRINCDLQSSKYFKDSTLKFWLLRFNSIYALIECLRNWIGEIKPNRKKVIAFLDKLQKMEQGELASAAFSCHLKQNLKKSNDRKQRCALCICETYLKKYESILFNIVNTSMPAEDFDINNSENIDDLIEDPVNPNVDDNEEENKAVSNLKNASTFEAYNAGNWQASKQEHVIRMLISTGRSRSSEVLWVDEGKLYLTLLESIKKEFRFLRLLWTQLFDSSAAQDELSMAKLRLRLPYPGEKIHKKEKQKEIYVVAEHEVECEKIRLESEKTNAEKDLKRKLGILLYLQNLLKIKENKDFIDVCPICRSQLKDKWSVLSCGHYICFYCIPSLLDACGSDKLQCPMCREPTDSSEISHIEGEYNKEPELLQVKGSHSTKIHSVVYELKKLINQDENVKVLIFSIWDKVLDLLEEAFNMNDISYRRLGNNNLKKKNLALSEFKNENITALLLSIKHGSKGLNLIEATHIFLVEPLLNPADELQAIGRVHRIGQTKETFVHRFVIIDTIEERMFSVITNSKPEEWNKQNLTVARLVNLFVVENENSQPETNVRDINVAEVV